MPAYGTCFLLPPNGFLKPLLRGPGGSSPDSAEHLTRDRKACRGCTGLQQQGVTSRRCAASGVTAGPLARIRDCSMGEASAIISFARIGKPSNQQDLASWRVSHNKAGKTAPPRELTAAENADCTGQETEYCALSKFQIGSSLVTILQGLVHARSLFVTCAAQGQRVDDLIFVLRMM